MHATIAWVGFDINSDLNYSRARISTLAASFANNLDKPKWFGKN